MGIHEWSYDNDIAIDAALQGSASDKVKALSDINAEVELGFDLQLAWKEAQRCLNCDIQTVFHRAVHRVRRLCRYLPDGQHLLRRQWRGS